jgi:hypothetical protein
VSTVTEVQPYEPELVRAEDVADSRSAARWSVEESGWKQLLPELPDDVIALLAPPVVVSARSIVPQQPAQLPQRAQPAQLTQRAQPAQPQLLAPAPPRRAAMRRPGRS